MAPRFSIIIPTRERLRTLGPCLKTCLAQSHSDFEIVVQDNASSDGTRAFVTGLSDPRIKYFCNPERTSMRQNFENAFANATGEYLISIGDDDGLVPGGLDNLDRALGQQRFDFATWPAIFYFWPGYGEQTGIPFKRVNVFGAKSAINGRTPQVHIAAGKSVHFRLMPKVYHGCVSRALIERVRQQTGQVFLYDIPDIYAQAALTFVAERGISLGHPVSILGASTSSTGSSQFNGAANAATVPVNDPFASFVKEASADHTSPIPYNSQFAAISYYMYVSTMVAGQAFGRPLALNEDAWMKRIVQELSRDAHTFATAVSAPSMSEIDDRLLGKLRAAPVPPTPASATSSNGSSKRRPRYLSRCTVVTEIDGEDTVETAMRALGATFANHAVNYAPVPGWQVWQAQSWAQMLIANRGRLSP